MTPTAALQDPAAMPRMSGALTSGTWLSRSAAPSRAKANVMIREVFIPWLSACRERCKCRVFLRHVQEEAHSRRTNAASSGKLGGRRLRLSGSREVLRSVPRVHRSGRAREVPWGPPLFKSKGSWLHVVAVATFRPRGAAGFGWGESLQ